MAEPVHISDVLREYVADLLANAPAIPPEQRDQIAELLSTDQSKDDVA